jgi:regulator of sirC expression with transglutaminase-like and TPR domain
MELDTALSTLARDPDSPLDLAELALRLDHDEYPEVDVDAYLSELAGMAHEVRPYLRGDLQAQVKGLCRYLFHDLGFRGNQSDYYDPRNSYFNQVIDRRVGIPITLSALALSVGRRAGLPLVGVGLPGHFVAKAVGEEQEVLFDPYHGGRLLTPEQCEALVRKVTGRAFQATRESLQAVPLCLLLVRMLNNLKAIYFRTGDFLRAARTIGRLRQLNPNDPNQHRDLGACLINLGRPGRAIDQLTAYLQAAPGAADADVVRQWLHTARREVARWN